MSRKTAHIIAPLPDDDEPSVVVRGRDYEAVKDRLRSDPKTLVDVIIIDKLGECADLMSNGFKSMSEKMDATIVAIHNSDGWKHVARELFGSVPMRALGFLFAIGSISLGIICLLGVAWTARQLGFDLTAMVGKLDPYSIALLILLFVGAVAKVFGVSVASMKRLGSS